MFPIKALVFINTDAAKYEFFHVIADVELGREEYFASDNFVVVTLYGLICELPRYLPYDHLVGHDP